MNRNHCKAFVLRNALFARVEALEGRALLSAAPLGVSQTAFDGGQQLRIVGTAGNDQIKIVQTAAGLTVSGGAGASQTLAPASGVFKQIWVDAGAGDDVVTLDASVTVNAVLYGGAGNDTLVGGSGNDRLYGGQGVNVLNGGAGDDVLVSVGGSAGDTDTGGAGRDSFWVDANPTETVTDLSPDESTGGDLHRVGSFLGTAAPATPAKPVRGVKANRKGHAAKANVPPPVVTTAGAMDLLGQNLADPALTAGATGYKNFAGLDHPLFADAGPTIDDVSQGDVGDCYFLATLASVAKADPNRIRQSVVDLGDGTYAAQFHKANGTSVYVRVDADLPTASGGALAYADFGKQGSMWVAVEEKAYAFFRTGAGSYKSIDAGWMDEAYTALGSASHTTYSAAGQQNLMNLIGAELAAGKSVTMAFNTVADRAPVITDHAYTVVSVNRDATGRAVTLTVRNPWGIDGAGFDGKDDGYVTLTAQQAFDSFLGFVSAAV